MPGVPVSVLAVGEDRRNWFGPGPEAASAPLKGGKLGSWEEEPHLLERHTG